MGSTSLINLMVSRVIADVKQHRAETKPFMCLDLVKEIVVLFVLSD